MAVYIIAPLHGFTNYTTMHDIALTLPPVIYGRACIKTLIKASRLRAEIVIRVFPLWIYRRLEHPVEDAFRGELRVESRIYDSGQHRAHAGHVRDDDAVGWLFDNTKRHLVFPDDAPEQALPGHIEQSPVGGHFRVRKNGSQRVHLRPLDGLVGVLLQELNGLDSRCYFWICTKGYLTARAYLLNIRLVHSIELDRVPREL